MKVYRLPRGGFRIADSRVPGTDSETGSRLEPCTIAYLPAISVVPLTQHAGPPARALVAAGDLVHEGMLVGRAEARGAAHVHAPVSGRVLKLVRWRMSDGRETEAIVLRMQGAFTLLGKRRESWDADSISPHELRRVLQDKGLVDMEGDGTPLGDLITRHRSTTQGSVLLFNAVFDDPWKTANRYVAREYPQKMVRALSLLARAASIESIYCAIAPEDRELARALAEEAVSRNIPLEFLFCERKYPLGSREELSLLLYKRGEGAAAAKRSSTDPHFVVGASTLLAVHDALVHNLPLLERHIAVGGSAVKHPAILRVRLGTRIGDVIAECGGFIDDPGRIVLNSLITGPAIDDLDVPITKTIHSVIVEGRSAGSSTRTALCISCGECRQVCPRLLDPERLLKLSLRGRIEEMYNEGLDTCIACNACAVVCPSRIPIPMIFRSNRHKGAPNES